MPAENFSTLVRKEIAKQERELQDYNKVLASLQKPPVQVDDPMFQKIYSQWMSGQEDISSNQVEEEYMSWHHKIPIVNIFYDMFLDEPLGEEQLKELLNLIGLVSALLLSVAGGFPGMTSFQEIQDALGRFSLKDDVSWSFCSQTSSNSAPPLQDQRYKTRCGRIFGLGNSYVTQPFGDTGAHWYINALGNYVNASIALLTMSLLGTIFIYMFLVVTSFDSPGKIVKKEARKLHREELYIAWWYYVRIALLYVVVCLVSGMITFYYSVHRLIIVKFPSVVVEETNTARLFSNEPLYQFGVWGFAGIGGGTIFVWIMMSASLYKKYRLFFSIKHSSNHNTANDHLSMVGEKPFDMDAIYSREHDQTRRVDSTRAST